MFSSSFNITRIIYITIGLKFYKISENWLLLFFYNEICLLFYKEHQTRIFNKLYFYSQGFIIINSGIFSHILFFSYIWDFF